MAVSNKKPSWVWPRPVSLWRYVRDPKVRLWKKLLLAVVVIYVLLPTDLVADFIPIWGWLDDLGVLSIAALTMSRVLARYPASGPDKPKLT
jgi:uncharacterized membrane protein YkvA (DUF1232 family)